ncbi:MAG: phosphonopyruvate decarboxylase, partial [Candidatus Delongbacteria bacterium]|nr:phosphonopyruvate decarboxylase [Candidatus Delongbacteria bacterium]
SSQIALGIALNTDRPVICLDGDGATIMHMGSMAIIGNSSADNYFHIVLNNGSHDSVGGQPTEGLNIDLVQIALSCGYRQAISVDKESEIRPAFEKLKTIKGPVFMEIKVKTGARSNLGRPTKTPVENKDSLMKTLDAD